MDCPAYRLTTANEVDDFVGVAWLNSSIIPAGSGQDFKVALDRNAVGAQAQVPEQAGHS